MRTKTPAKDPDEEDHEQDQNDCDGDDATGPQSQHVNLRRRRETMVHHDVTRNKRSARNHAPPLRGLPSKCVWTPVVPGATIDPPGAKGSH